MENRQKSEYRIRCRYMAIGLALGTVFGILTGMYALICFGGIMGIFLAGCKIKKAQKAETDAGNKD